MSGHRTDWPSYALQKSTPPFANALERESDISRELVKVSSYYSYAITCSLETMSLIFIWAVLVLDVENCISGIESLVWHNHVLVATIHGYFSNDQLRQIKLQRKKRKMWLLTIETRVTLEKRKEKRLLHLEGSHLQWRMQAPSINESSHFFEALISSPAKRKHITCNTGLTS